MAEERIDLDSFLEKMITGINRRFEKQEEKLAELEKDMDLLRKEMKSKKKNSIAKSVMRVLKE